MLQEFIRIYFPHVANWLIRELVGGEKASGLMRPAALMVDAPLVLEVRQVHFFGPYQNLPAGSL